MIIRMRLKGQMRLLVIQTKLKNDNIMFIFELCPEISQNRDSTVTILLGAIELTYYFILS